MDPLIPSLIGALVTITMALYLRHLTKVDAEQEKRHSEFQRAIDLLFEKHDQDAKRLDIFELDIAKHHYQKNELDARFDKLERAFENGFKSLGDKFDNFAQTMKPGK